MVCGQKDGQREVGKRRNEGETRRSLKYASKKRTAMRRTHTAELIVRSIKKVADGEKKMKVDGGLEENA